MGERLINPIHNIFKKYRKVNLVNPYLFAKPFVSTWRTSSTSAGSSTSTQIKLPLISTGTYNFTVNWGDGSSSTITTWNQAQVTHTYAVAGDYVISITGTCIGWQFNSTGDRLKIRSIQSWGKLRVGTTQGNYFNGCTNLNLSGVTDILDTTGTTIFTGFFTQCTSLTTIGRLNEWNTSTVTAMNQMFSKSYNFNQNIGAWDVSLVVNFSDMFECAFTTKGAFNNGGSNTINNWVTSSATNMSGMFNNSNFNQPIGNWNTALVTSFNVMFRSANLFNQNIGAWNVSNCINYMSMFWDAFDFNNGGSNTINNWVLKTTGTINMDTMFTNCNFNQPIGNWNMIAVNSVNAMFQGSVNFNQNIGSWDIRNCVTFTNFMALKTPATFSTTNLDAIYNGWSTRPVIASRTITFGTAKYTVGASAGRAILTSSPNFWSIVDGGI